MAAGHWITAIASLVIGLTAGIVMHRSDFCMSGMIRDLFLFHTASKLKILALLVFATMVLVEGARLSSLITIFPFPGFGPPGLANIIGGALFGIGMVLAGGCVAGTLYKMGSGSVLSIAAFIGLISGSTLYAEFHPTWKSFSDATLFVRGKSTVAQIIGISHGHIMFVAVLILGVPVLRWWFKGDLKVRSFASGYLQPWKAALVLAVATVLSVVIIGMPLGITTSYTKIGALLERCVAPDHVAGMVYFKALPFNYPNHLLGITYSGGPGPDLDSASLIQYPLVIGIVAGGFISAFLLGEFRPRWRIPVRQYVSALIGGMLMGLAARMAPSCNIWHLVGGLPVLMGQSVLFFIGLLPGAWIGGRVLTSLVVR